MLVRSRLRLRRRGGGAASGGGGDGGITNTVLPSILTSPIELGKTVSLDGGEWDGVYDSIEVRLQQGSTLAAPGTIWLDWTDLPAGVASATEGQPCYIAARAVVGGVPGTPVINPFNFGPWTAFTEAFVGRYDFRATIAAATSPSDVFVVAASSETGSVSPSGSPSGMASFATMAAVSGDGTNWANCGGYGNPRNRGSRGGRLAGQFQMTSATSWFGVSLPNGWYKVRVIQGDPSNSISSGYSNAVRDGTGSSDTTRLSYLADHASNALSVNGVSTAISTITGWTHADPAAGPWSAAFEVTNGAIRLDWGTSSGSGPSLICLDIKTAEAPE